MNLKLIALVSLSATAASAFADTPFRMTNPTMGYTRTWTTSKSKSAATSTESKNAKYRFWTGPFNPEFRVRMDNLYFYLVPAESTVGLSMNMDALELGALLSLSQSTAKTAGAKSSDSAHTIGLFGKFSMPMGDDSLEFHLRPAYTMTNTGVVNGAKEQTGSGFSVMLKGGYVWKATERLEISPNLAFTYSSHTKKHPAGFDETTDTKNELELSLADFRLHF